MSQALQGDSSYTALTLPLKRGRGRPRKDPSLKRVRTVQVPPGFGQAKEIRPRQVDTDNVAANDGMMIGQPVTGIVEAAFDAGYLLSVRIGDSYTNFRGVVFKPGQFDPVTSTNDVAPHVQMIKRNELHLPIKNQVQVHSQNRSEKTAKLNQIIAPYVPSVGARGTVLPVVLQPVNPTSGLPPTTRTPPNSSQEAHMAVPKERGLQTVAPLATLPPDGSQSTSQATQVNDQESLVTGQDGDGGEGTPLVQHKEVKSIVSNNTGKPVEVTKGIQGSFVSPNTNTKNHESSHKLSAGKSSIVAGRDIGDMNELPSIEPNDTVNSSHPTQATSVSKPLMNYGIGRMTELLQAVQENMMENQVNHAGESNH